MKNLSFLFVLCFGMASAQVDAIATGCPTAGIAASITICDSSVTPISLFDLLVGASSGGNWTRISGTGGTFDALLGTFTPAENATDSSFIYSIVGVAPCLDDSTIVFVNVVQQPTAVALSGIQNICIGLTSSFVASVAGGLWSSSDTSIASADTLTGVVTGNASGTTSIHYTLAFPPCIDAVFTRTITIMAPPEQPSIQGFPGICAGSYTTFSASIPGGFWSSSNNSVAMIDTTGFVLGITSGTAIITYTMNGSGGCGNKSASRNVRVTSTPSIVLTSDPSTANQIVCLNTPIIPITYAVDLLDASGGDATGLPNGLSGSNNAGLFTISGTPTQTGSFPYIAHAVAWCGFASLPGQISVLPESSTTLFCDPAQATGPNTVFFDWGPMSGATNYQYSYAINNGAEVNGSTTVSNFEVANVSPGQNVTFTLTNVLGVNCFQPISATCSSLSNEYFDSIVPNIFPNPVENMLNVNAPLAIKNIRIFNVVGQQVFENGYSETELRINLTHLIRGIYFVRVCNATAIKTFKIFKN